MNRGKLVENYESISEGEEGGCYYIPISGWNLENENRLIIKLMEEHFDYRIKDVKILSKSELAYSCSRYANGEDANDSGFAWFIEYYNKWKKGLGKCTRFKVRFAYSELDEVQDD